MTTPNNEPAWAPDIDKSGKEVPPAAEETPGSDDKWEEPILLRARAELPPFPTEVFPGYIAAMIQAVAEEIQVPEDLPGALALAALATAAGGRAEVAVKGQWREPLNLMLAVAMPPGAGKSPVFNAMMGPIFRTEKDLQEAIRVRIAECEAERRTAMADAEELMKKAKSPNDLKVAVAAELMAQQIAVPVIPRLTADDTSPEQATTILAEQGGRLAILAAEGTFFEVIMGRYSSNGRPNVELVLKGHAGDRLQVDRRGRGEFVERPSLTIGLCIQPQMLRDIAAKPQMAGRGVLARFLFSLPPDLVGKRKITPDLTPEEVLRAYGETMKQLAMGLSDWTDPALLTMTPAALKLFTEWRAEIEPRLLVGTGDLETLREWASKLAGHTARFAGVLHLAENPMDGHRSSIQEGTMERAIKLARYYVDHAKAAFGVMEEHPLLDKARKVLKWAEGKKTFKRRDAHRCIQKQAKSVGELVPVLKLLEDYGYIRRMPPAATVGRPSIMYEVHPHLAVTR
ncbi:YfjI family protein [Nonomuraea sp. NPDC049158]|uniref:YfjI family protein n=1 Tax=Nonomuraea sp. NPDC049158 TaxID=3155649 RepID=UPI0033F6E009